MILSRTRLPLASFLGLCLLHSTALAEHYLNVTVTGTPESSISPSVATARTKAEQTPGGVDVVAREEYGTESPRNLRDMLTYSPGVMAQERFGNEEVRLSVRGSGLSRSFHLRGISILQDGIPLNVASGDGEFQEIDPLALDYLEVYRGANALRYGSMLPGGAIHLVTPTGVGKQAEGQALLEGGSFGQRRLHSDIAHDFGQTDAYLSVTASGGDGYREQSDYDSLRLNGNVGIELTDRVETRFYASVNRLNQQIPGSLSYRNALDNPEDAHPANLTGNYGRDIDSFRLANRTRWNLGHGSAVEVGGYLYDKQLYHPIFAVLDYDSRDYGLYGRGETHYHTGDVLHELVGGVNFTQGTIDAKQYANNAGARGMLMADTDQVSRNLDLYAEHRSWVRPDVAVILGGQLYHATRKVENPFNPVAGGRAEFQGLNPKIGVLWQTTPDIQLFANLSKNREVPTYSELVQFPVVGFVPLDATKAWTAELGSRGRYGRFGWDIAAYHGRYTGEFLQFTPGPGIPASTFNAGDTIHQGIELGLDATLWHSASSGWWLDWRQAYSWNDFRFDHDPVYGNNQLAGVPEHLLRAELRLGHRDGHYIAPRLEWVPGGMEADFTNSLDTPGYAVVGLGGEFALNPGLSLYADGRNLFDRRGIGSLGTVVDFATAGNQEIFYPIEGRSLMVGVKASF